MTQNDGSAWEELLLRVSFLFVGGFAFAEGLQNWIRGKIETHPEVAAIILVTYMVAFVSLGIGVSSSQIVRRLRHVPLVTLVGLVLASAYVISQAEFNGAYRSDSLAFTHYAAILSIRGTNPYSVDLQNALAVFSVDPEFITLTPSGSLVTTLNYPALSFLFFVPAVVLGIRDMRVIIFVFEIATLLSIYYWAPAKVRPIILLPLFAGSDLVINFSAGTIADYLWVFPLVCMLFSLKTPRLAGALYGLACAAKQTPWLLAPFLMIWMYEDGEGSVRDRLKRTLMFAAASAAFFLLPNIPFILLDYASWWGGVVTPSFGNLVILSQGLSMVSEAGLIPLPPDFYLVAFVAVFATLLFNYAVYFDKLKHAIWVLPAVVMWFSYRGLQNYFIFWVPLLAASAVCILRERV
jgi:uncharacterized membrane protein